MTNPRFADLHLSLDLDADPIAGLAHGEDGADTPFSGWIGLVRTIERLLDEGRVRRERRSGEPRAIAQGDDDTISERIGS
jgi:hypothetical protein